MKWYNGHLGHNHYNTRNHVAWYHHLQLTQWVHLFGGYSMIEVSNTRQMGTSGWILSIFCNDRLWKFSRWSVPSYPLSRS